MKIIHKFDVNSRCIYVPIDSKVLCVKVQDGIPRVWILIGMMPENVCLKQFEIIGTGQEFDDANRSYVGTYFEHGIYVWHVFEVL